MIDRTKQSRDWIDGWNAAMWQLAGVEPANGPPCTCHPDDRPPGECQRRYAVGACVAAYNKASRAYAEK
jgi:hypothetical protein